VADRELAARLSESLAQAERQLGYLRETAAAVAPRLPCDADSLRRLEAQQESRDLLVAFTARFGLLQEMLQSTLFRAIAEMEAERPASNRMLVELMDRLGIVPSAGEFLEDRKHRNVLAHLYVGDEGRRAEAFNYIFGRVDALAGIIERTRRHVEPRLEDLRGRASAEPAGKSTAHD
jgi:uncharacterized protein YutE (UPF0331/DUF86 family)